MKYFLIIFLFSFPAYAEKCDVKKYFPPEQKVQPIIVGLIDNSKSYVHLVSYQLTAQPIIQALERAKARGVDVKALLDKSQKKNVYKIDHRYNKRYKLQHNKVMIFDGAVAINGSYNFTKNAENYNSENLTVYRDCEGNFIQEYEDKFQSLWAGSK